MMSSSAEGSSTGQTTIPDASFSDETTVRYGGPTFDHFVLSQIPMALAVALVFGIIAFAAVHYMPAGAGGPAAAGGAAVAEVTAFATEPAAQKIVVDADPGGALKWTKDTYEAQAGDVTFVVNNKSMMPHNFAVEGPGVKAQGANFGANTTTTYTLKGLKPGEYLIVCNFPGHRASGMVSKLIVK